MTTPGTESQFEDTTIERLKALGYEYQPASLLNRDLKSVVLADRLRTHLARRYTPACRPKPWTKPWPPPATPPASPWTSARR
ncbi:MAG: hypothetical protein ACE5LU_03665 [Anaerolineae bacterium]